MLVMLLVIVGCSRQQQEEAGEVLDYSTGKTQVETYQRVKTQLKTIQQDQAQPLE